jgi:phosphonatase-like hydrolase
MIELVVFDIAGTTVEDGDAVKKSFCAALSGAGIEVDPELVKAVMGLAKPEAIRILLASTGRSFSEGEVEATHEDFVRRMRAHYEFDPSVCEIPGAAAAFATLRRAGIKVALNTGFGRTISQMVLARLGWHAPAVIDADVASDEVPRGRPHPDMIRFLMARLGVTDPRRVAKVGDTKADLEEGTNAGCGMVIGVTSGTFTREQLQALPHTHILGSVAEVPELVLSAIKAFGKKGDRTSAAP